MATQTFVFVLGGPGSGKGTLCQKLKEGYPDWEHISVGELLRKEVAKESEKGQQWAQLMSKGQMVPTEDVLGLLEGTIKESSLLKFFLDGFPRAPDQVEAFQKKMGKPTSAIVINVPEEVLKGRLLERAAASGRLDDNEDTIAERLKMYSQCVQPCVEPLQEICKVQIIDGDRIVTEVYEDVKAMVNEIEETPTKVESEDAPLEPSKEESSNQDAPAVSPENSEQNNSTDTMHPETSTAPPEGPSASIESDTENKAAEDPASSEQTVHAPGDAPADTNKEIADNSSSTPQQASSASCTESPVNAVSEPPENSGKPEEMSALTEDLDTEVHPETTQGAADELLKTPLAESQPAIPKNAQNDSQLDTNADLPEESMVEKPDDGAELSTAGLTPENLSVDNVGNLSEPVSEPPKKAPAETVQETAPETAPIEESPEPVTDDNLNQAKVESKSEEDPVQKPVDVPETVPDQSGNLTPSGTKEEMPQSTGEVCTEDQPRNSGTEPSVIDNSTEQPTYVEPLDDSAESATKKSDSSGAVLDAPLGPASSNPPADDIEMTVEKEETPALDDLEESPATLIPEEQNEIIQDTPTAAEDISAAEEDAEVSKNKEDAVVRIQAAERGRRTRKALKQEKALKEEKAAIVIQRAGRNYVARRETKVKNEAIEGEKAKTVGAEAEAEVEVEVEAKAKAEEEKKAAPVNEETNEVDKPPEDNLEPEPTGRVAGRVPVREYMDSTVVPILREGLKSLNQKRPADPLQYLADFLLDRKKSFGQK